jgi:type IV pilus assembly protein PilE
MHILHRHGGFTLVECLAACAIAALMAAVALPSFQGQALRTSRLDAVQALTRLQLAQEQYRAAHGLYATDLTALRGVVPVSDQGRYTLSLALTGPDSYRATAQARGAQAQDGKCPALTLDVSDGWAQAGPSAQCWNR